MGRVRARKQRERRRPVLTVPERIDLDVGSRISPFASSAARRRAWQIHADELVATFRTPGARPAAWWAYEPGIPRRLRRLPPRPDPRLGMASDFRDPEYSAQREARERIEDARSVWLAEHGHIDAPELARLEEFGEKHPGSGRRLELVHRYRSR